MGPAIEARVAKIVQEVESLHEEKPAAEGPSREAEAAEGRSRGGRRLHNVRPTKDTIVRTGGGPTQGLGRVSVDRWMPNKTDRFDGTIAPRRIQVAGQLLPYNNEIPQAGGAVVGVGFRLRPERQCMLFFVAPNALDSGPINSIFPLQAPPKKWAQLNQILEREDAVIGVSAEEFIKHCTDEMDVPYDWRTNWHLQ
ncbi:hypothetical protein THAOC_27814, partial [Thalassiosira oceanica]